MSFFADPNFLTNLLDKYGDGDGDGDESVDDDGDEPPVRRSERIAKKNRKGRKKFLNESADEASHEGDESSVCSYDDCNVVGIDITNESLEEASCGSENNDDDDDDSFISVNDEVVDSDASVFEDDDKDDRSPPRKRRRIIDDSDSDESDEKDKADAPVDLSVSNSDVSHNDSKVAAARPTVAPVSIMNISIIQDMQRRQRFQEIDHLISNSGIQLNGHDERWVDGLKQWNEHVVKTRDINGSRLGHDPYLQNWVSTQRRKFRNNNLEDWRHRLLFHFGFQFS